MMRMAKVTAPVCVALAMLALVSCHGRVPRPGKPGGSRSRPCRRSSAVMRQLQIPPDRGPG